jgi:hypothetical protein
VIAYLTFVFLDQTQINQTNSSIAAKQNNYCAGISPYASIWQLYSTDGIMMNIDTSNCSFNSTPLYFTSVSGISSHWGLADYGAIYVPTTNSFLIFARSLVGWNNT